MKRLFVLTGAVISMVFLAPNAHAEEPTPPPSKPFSSPTSYGARGVNLPSGVFRPDLLFSISDIGATERYNLGVGLEWGLFDRFNIGASYAPLIDPGFAHNHPALYGRYQLYKEGDFELTTQFGYTFNDAFPGTVNIGLPMLWRFSPTMRLKFAAMASFHISPRDVDVDYSINIPISYAFHFTPQFYMDLQTGLNFPFLQLEDQRFLTIPLGMELGYNFTKDDPRYAFIDLYARFTWDLFAMPHPNESAGPSVGDTWQALVGMRFYFTFNAY